MCGHDHSGGYKNENGVHHITVQSPLECEVRAPYISNIYTHTPSLHLRVAIIMTPYISHIYTHTPSLHLRVAIIIRADIKKIHRIPKKYRVDHITVQSSLESEGVTPYISTVYSYNVYSHT